MLYYSCKHFQLLSEIKGEKMSQKIIGIDLGGTSIKFAILTTTGEIQEKWSIKTNILDEGSHIVDDMIESISHRLDQV